MDRKTILAIVLSGAVWIVWFAFFKPEVPQDQAPAPQQQEIENNTKKDQDRQAPSTAETGTGSVKVQAMASPGSEKSFDISTDIYKVSFTNKGAAIKSITMKDRGIDIVVTDPPHNVHSNLDFALHFNDDEFINYGPLDETLWAASTEKDRITFSTKLNYNGNPLLIEKLYSFNKDTYEFSVTYRFTNMSSQTFQFRKGTVIISPAELLGPKMDYTNRYNTVSGIYSKDKDFETAAKGGGMFSKPSELQKDAGNIDWFGLSSRYYLAVMIPDGFTGTGIIRDNREESGYRTGMYTRIGEMKPRETITRSFRVYLGERDKSKLKAVDPAIVDAADVSKFIEPIRYFVIWSLLKINGLIGNMGWSLVIFSLLTKLVFMPLTIKSTESMKRMQQLTPIMNEVKAKYKDKPDVMQKEMMKMYKEHGVNPMGGCLPILLQMPFFFALYSALINSIDLWHAPFILWMKDLSMPDTVLTISGYNLNILPIIMTITTFLQQKLTTVDTGNAPQQKIMTTIMPVVFIFIFWSMPSGLVLYWALQNVFQVAHQLLVNRFGKKEE